MVKKQVRKRCKRSFGLFFGPGTACGEPVPGMKCRECRCASLLVNNFDSYLLRQQAGSLFDIHYSAVLEIRLLVIC
jgi:hypothetical protein